MKIIKVKKISDAPREEYEIEKEVFALNKEFKGGSDRAAISFDPYNKTVLVSIAGGQQKTVKAGNAADVFIEQIKYLKNAIALNEQALTYTKKSEKMFESLLKEIANL